MSQTQQQEPHWYVVHTYSGYENKVKQSIETKAENQGLTDAILEVRIPIEEHTEKVGGKDRVYASKIYPGYVLVHMIHNDEVAYLIRSIRGVTGFLGADPNKPIPLTDEEVEQMGIKIVREEITCNIHVGDEVHIAGADDDNAAYNGLHGKVVSVDAAAGRCTVLIRWFNRDTTTDFPLENVFPDF